MERRLWLMGLAAAILWSTDLAAVAGPRTVQQQAELRMLVTGAVDIEPDGNVSHYRLDRADQLPSAVTETIGKSIAHWRFEPMSTDRRETTLRARMNLSMRARELSSGRYFVEIRNARFSASELKQGNASIRRSDKIPPKYPYDAIRAGVSGTVYLVLKIGVDGRVENVAAERVDLRVVSSESRMKFWRDRLAEASVEAARRWTFASPSGEEGSNASLRSVRVPVDFLFSGRRGVGYGEWETHVPGPRQKIPWATSEPGFALDTLSPGEVYLHENHGPRLMLTRMDAP